MFNEDNTIEQMLLNSLKQNGWKYIEAENLPRQHNDVMVEPMVKEALIRLNPVIAEETSRADEVIYTILLPETKASKNSFLKRILSLLAKTDVWFLFVFLAP